MQKYYYLIHLQYLGFRFHGWQKQPKVKTVQGMVEKTLFCIFEHKNFKTLAVGRTDAMVSVNTTAFELFVQEKLDPEKLLLQLNSNFPNDIKALSVEEVDENFNVIKHSKTKEYVYLFSFGEKPHPFSASLMASFKEKLDINLMREGAKLFEGTHNFRKYCCKPSKDTVFNRTILACVIEENTLYTANFFPKKSYAFRVEGKGFMRYQIRLMMGALYFLGKGKLTLKDIENSLQGDDPEPFTYIAPASGLILHNMEFDR